MHNVKHDLKDKRHKELKAIKKLARNAMFEAVDAYNSMQIPRAQLDKDIENIRRMANEYRNEVVNEYEAELEGETERLRHKALGPLDKEDLLRFSELEDKFTNIAKDKNGVFQLEQEYARAVKNDDEVKARALAVVAQTKAIKSIAEDYNSRVPDFKENVQAYNAWEGYRTSYERKMSEWHLNEFRFLPSPKLGGKKMEIGQDKETGQTIIRERIVEIKGDFDSDE